MRALSGDDLVRHHAFVRERALRDEITEKEFAKAEGRAESEMEGELKFLRRLLQAKFGELPARVQQHMQLADTAQLERWGEQVLTALTLEEVFSAH